MPAQMDDMKKNRKDLNGRRKLQVTPSKYSAKMTKSTTAAQGTPFGHYIDL